MRQWLAIMVLAFAARGVVAEDDPADANAAADVSQAEPAEHDSAESAAEPAADPQDMPVDEPVSDTVQQMRLIEALPIIVPDDPPTTQATPVMMDVKAALRNRMNELLAEPAPTSRGEAVQRQLVELTNNASQLALLTDPGPEQFDALSVQMQALYARITEATDAMETDRLLSRLRSAARRTKAIDLPQAPAIGDFWLMTAELFDLNRTPLSTEAKREQAAALMAEYLEDHPEAGPAESVRTAYIDLQQVRGIEVDPSSFSRDPEQGEGQREAEVAAPPPDEQPAPAE